MRYDGTEVIKALLKVQGEIRNPENTARNPIFRSKYAALPDILNMVRPILNQHDLILVQDTGSSEKGVFVKTILMHKSGEMLQTSELYLRPVNNKQNPVENTPQPSGSAITYARRYQLTSLLGISGEDDNDGNAPRPPQQKTAPQPSTKFETPKIPEQEVPYSEDDETPEEVAKQWVNEIVSIITSEGKLAVNKDSVTMRAKRIASKGEVVEGMKLSKQLLHQVLEAIDKEFAPEPK